MGTTYPSDPKEEWKAEENSESISAKQIHP
jgi:hypothetical protein